MLKPDEGSEATDGDAATGSGTSLGSVERRRRELLAVTLFVLVAFAVGMVLLSFTYPTVDIFARSLPAVRIGVLLLSVAFAAYVVEKERSLRLLNHSLIAERVLSAQLLNRLEEVELLERAGAAVVSSRDLGEMLEVVLASASELLDADGGSILLRHDDHLVVAAVTGACSLITGQRRGVEDGPLGDAARTGKPTLAGDSGLFPSLTVPLEAEGALLGVLTVGGRRFEEYDVRRLKLFAQHAAVAIRDARRRRTESLSCDEEDDRPPVLEIHHARDEPRRAVR